MAGERKVRLWGAGKGGQAHPKPRRQLQLQRCLQPHSLPPHTSISSKPLDKQPFYSLEFVLAPFSCGPGSVPPGGSEREAQVENSTG